MYQLFVILAVISAVITVLIVLVQDSKGGMGGQFGGGGGSQMFGAKKSGDLLENITWFAGLAFIAFCITATVMLKSEGTDNVQIDNQKEAAGQAAPVQ